MFYLFPGCYASLALLTPKVSALITSGGFHTSSHCQDEPGDPCQGPWGSVTVGQPGPPNALTGSPPLHPWLFLSTQMEKDLCHWSPHVAGIKETSVSQP